jgi:hypothetical protein
VGGAVSDTEMLDDRWQHEVTAPDGRRCVVVAARRHHRLHEDDTPHEARALEAAIVVRLLVIGVQSWRARRDKGWTVAVLTRPGILGQKVLYREDLPFDADPVARAEQLVEQVRRGELAL